MKHATITIEEVENGMLVNIVDDDTRRKKASRKSAFTESIQGGGPTELSELLQVLKPNIYIASTVEDACKRITEYFNYREKV